MNFITCKIHKYDLGGVIVDRKTTEQEDIIGILIAKTSLRNLNDDLMRKGYVFAAAWIQSEIEKMDFSLKKFRDAL